MAQRTYSVVVSTERSSKSIEELARHLESVTRQSPERLARALERGPLTVDADLRLEEAERLLERLERFEVPAAVVDEEGEHVRETEIEPASEPEHAFPPIEEPGGGESATASEESDMRAPRLHQDSSVTFLDVDLFNDDLPSLDELEGGRDGGTAQYRAIDTEAEDDTEDTQPNPRAATVSEPEATPRRAGPAFQSALDPGEDDPAADDEREFDASRLNEVLNDEESVSKPARSEGFDDRPDHSPGLAAFLSAVAPGAGQKFNGQSEKAWHYAPRSLLIVPWITGIRQAYRRGVEIKDGDAARPKEGAFVDAIKHLVVMWLVIAGMVGLFVWSIGTVQTVSSRTMTATTAGEKVAGAIGAARMDVQAARIHGVDSLDRAVDEKSNQKIKFTMSSTERAERLFEIGYEYCRARKLAMCESSMQRVVELDSGHRRSALRLQAWASVQQNPNAPNQELPEIETATVRR